jgi:hypothetical protein
MAKLSNFKKRHTHELIPHLDKVATFLGKMKVGDSMPSADIYKEMGKLPIGLDTFKVGFSVAVNQGMITGMKSVKRSGFKRIGDINVVSVDIGPPPSAHKTRNHTDTPPIIPRIPPSVQGTVIQITDTIRIRAGSHNWTYQKKTGETWTSHKYWPDLQSALRLCAVHMFEQKIRTSGTMISSAQELIEAINKTEQHITDLLAGKERVFDEAPDDDDEEEAA